MFRRTNLVPAWLVTTLICVLVLDKITAETAASVAAPLGLVAALVMGAVVTFTFARSVTNN